MHRAIVAALITGAFGITAANAQSYYPNSTPYQQPAHYPPSYVQAEPAMPQPMPVRATRGDMGGGFIEFIFGDPRRPAPPGPPARYEPSLPVEEPAMQQQGYAPQPVYAPQPAAVPNMQRSADPRYARQNVAYHGKERPGTIVIDTPSKFLYLVEDDGRAIRYGIGVGRPGFTWAGVKTVSAKREWPDWRPPNEMLQRRPDLPRYMPGGPDNPLGARALYLGSSLYRIHGSNEPWTIGQQVSSGCIRMRNEDVIDLYGRVGVGTKVIVI